MTEHEKHIREAVEEGPYYTAMVAKDDLRALLADLDKARAALTAAKAGGWDLVSPRALVRAILALRPQAVPMTDEAEAQWRFICDRLNEPSMYQDRIGAFVEWFEAHQATKDNP